MWSTSYYNGVIGKSRTYWIKNNGQDYTQRIFSDPNEIWIGICKFKRIYTWGISNLNYDINT